METENKQDKLIEVGQKLVQLGEQLTQIVQTKDKLSEDLATPADPNIATTDENLSVNVMFQESSLPSLGRQIFSFVPINGPTGALFNIKKQGVVIAQAQVETATPTAADSTTYTLTINGIDFSYTSGVGATVAQITAGLVLEINVTQTNGSVPVTATDNTTNITLTADVAGTPFSVTSTGAGTIGIVQTTPNVVANPGKDIELVRNEVEVYPSESINTSLTKEAVQDLIAQHGKEARTIVGRLLRGLANTDENTKTLAFLTAKGLDYGNLTLSNSLNAETNVFEITQRVNEIVVKMNTSTLRTFDAFAVLPYQSAGAIMSLAKYYGDEVDEAGLFIGKIGRVKYYINPDVTSTLAFVGLKDPENMSQSSAVFSEYKSMITEGTDYDTGNTTYFIFNRFAITASPLHVTGNEMLYKFNIL